MLISKLISSSILLLAPFVLCVKEEQAKTEEEPAVVVPKIEFTYVFPKYHNNLLKTNEKTELLIGIKNIGDIEQHIVGLSGYFSSVDDFSKPTRNLTQYKYELTIAPKDEATVPYIFIPTIEPTKNIGLVVIIDHYDEEATVVKSIGFKEVVSVVGSDSYFDFESLTLYFLALGGIASSVWYAYGSKSSTKKNKISTSSSKDKEVVREVTAESLQDEWLPEHIKKEKAAKAKKRK